MTYIKFTFSTPGTWKTYRSTKHSHFTLPKPHQPCLKPHFRGSRPDFRQILPELKFWILQRKWSVFVGKY